MTAWLRRMRHRAGHRGAFLTFLALLDIIYGYSLLVIPARSRVYDLLLPWQAWGVIWLAAGIICAAGALLPTGADKIPFALEAALFTGWAAVFTRVWAYDHVPRGWASPVIWLAFAAVVLVVASWPEPPRRSP